MMSFNILNTNKNDFVVSSINVENLPLFEKETGLTLWRPPSWPIGLRVGREFPSEPVRGWVSLSGSRI